MEKNYKEKLKKNNGITLIALVITIIVLLILAGVSLSMVFNQDGIFNRAEQATDKYGQAKARETLELCLSEAQMRKYDTGLTEEELNEEIEKVGSLLPKEDPSSSIQQVIVDGYIFEVDRTVPKILDYIGPANGVIITAQIKQNGDWQNPVATVTGSITKYGGGSVTSSTATATNGVTISSFPTAGGEYTIANITTDTDITITAVDSEGKTTTKVIQVRLVKDTTEPTISGATATASGMKIKISVRATDNESGLKQINYSVSPTTITPNSNTITSGQEVELTATAEGKYTITFTATDNAGNTSTATAEATTIDVISVEEAKRLVTSMSALKEYVGKKVDYKPGETWQVFYYDDTGDFGPARTLYLKKAWTANDITLSSHTSHTPSDGGAMMKRMNPLWRDTTANSSSIDLENEHCVAWLCDPAEWSSQKNNTYSSFAIGSPSVEMYMKAFNVYKTGNKNATNLICKIGNANGYSVGANGSYTWNGSDEYYTGNDAIQPGPNNVFMTSGDNYWWLASPSSYYSNNVLNVHGNYAYVNYGGYYYADGVCPVVPLDR